MELLQSAFLGLVQGITEFLPISSSAHLFLLPHLLGWQYAGITFDLALHLGSLLAIVLYFWKDLWALIIGFLKAVNKPKRFLTDDNSRMSLYIALGIIPAGIVGFLFDDLIETTLRNPLISASLLIFVGIIFLVIEAITNPKRDFKHILLRDALIIGVAQCLALIPGVSRSGITMVTALCLGVKHEAAARFSFLLGTPITAAAAIFKLKDLAQTGLPSDMLAYFLVGMITAAISGYLAIRFLLTFLRKHSFTVFGWYRIAFGALALLILLMR